MSRDIFNIKDEVGFLMHCLETFRYQYDNVPVYRDFVNYLNVDPEAVLEIHQIPFLPIEMFKKHLVLDKNFAAGLYFQSSGTTSIQTLSKHYIADFALYEESIIRSFIQFIGPPEDFIILGLLPSYLERQNSSLIYMVDFLMKRSAKPENGYYLYNFQELAALLRQLSAENKKVLLFGVSFALLDFLDDQGENLNFYLNNLQIIETGGMKGRKKEMTKDELMLILKKGFKTDAISSEYSMTELLSQAYALENNLYQCPNWMCILTRNTEDPLSYVERGRTGAINIIDLANRHSCSFIATQDLGKVHADGRFEVLGRIDHSDIRGCSLLVS